MLLKDIGEAYGKRGQRILQEYDHSENSKRGINFDKLTHGTNQVVTWKCLKCGGNWESKVIRRTVYGVECPICANRIALKGYNDLYTYASQKAKNDKFFEKLIADIDWDENKKHEVSVYNVTVGSHVKLYWKCSNCGGNYIKDANQRLWHECPYCKGQSTLGGINDAETWCKDNPGIGDIIKEEFYVEENKKIGITLKSIRPKSNKEVYFKCKDCGCIWSESFAKRIKKICGCPICSSYKSNSRSFPEIFIYNALSSIIPNMEHNYKSTKYLEGMELDICLPDYKLAIEYDGSTFHNDLIDGDFPVSSNERLKRDLCNKYGVRLIHIYDGGDNEEPYINDNDIIVYKYIRSKFDSNTISTLSKIVRIILKEINIKDNINYNKTYKDTVYKISEVQIEDSLESKYPELAKQWDYENNGDNTPQNIGYKSLYRAHWVDKFNHKWEAVVYHRTVNKSGCPICAGQKICTGFNDLQSVNPELAKEYHSTLNSKPATEISATWHRKVYWQCIKCGYGSNGEWQAAPGRRQSKGYEIACPKCRYFWKTGQYKR